MSEDTYIFPNSYPTVGITGPGAPMPKANPQVLGNNEAVGNGAWEVLSLTGCQCATGVRLKNYGTESSYVTIANAASECPTKGFILEEGEEVFLEVDDLKTVWVKGVGGSATLTFIAS